MTTATAKETLGFQAEVKELLHLMVHSLYGNKETFLRELVSNASDACDKLRFEALTRKASLEDDADLKIGVEYDKAARTITITDNGVGMSRQEVIDHIGTIARSGTREFFSRLSGDEVKDARLIGQFGVGFYSAFIVAKKVTLTTRRAGVPANEAVRWESEGTGDYTIEIVERAARGTQIVLDLRDGEEALLEGFRLRAIIRKYSDHIQVPIRMRKEEWNAERKEQTITGEWETVNQANALWARPRAEVTPEQYEEFYRHVSHDADKPLAWTHARVEGTKEYTVLLYVPAHAPFDLWDARAHRGVRLYVRRVFIMDDAEHLMPRYLRFVRGVIDSADLPLNVSREILQESKDVDAIRTGATRRVLGLLEELAGADDAAQKEKYAAFWKEFGVVLKEGVGEDHANRERIARLLRFASTQTDAGAQTVSLADYAARMKPGQDKIYYVTAESFASASASPHLEIFRKKGIEVMLLSDRVDEWLVAHLPEFDGRPLQSVAKGALELDKLADDQEKQAAERDAGEYKDLLAKMKTRLGDRVKEVRITQRLTESASCLVSDAHELGGNLERILKAAGQKVEHQAPILELNPHHPLVERLKGEADDARFGDLAATLFDEAVLSEGGQLADPAGFVRRLNKLMLG